MIQAAIHIVPHKESGWTQIHLFLKNASWDTQDSLAQKIKGLMSRPGGRKAQVTDATSLDVEVDYDVLETFLELLTDALQSEKIRVTEKKILIEKLGGWFDV